MKEAREKGERQQFDREAMQKERDAQNAALKEILAPEQYEAYEKAQRERMQRGGNRGQGGGRPGGNRPRGNRPEGNGQSDNGQSI